MTPLPVLLDTDPGVDDALAMMLALRSPELDVLGICTVSGNVPVDVGTRNAMKILGLMGRLDVPVYGGAARPLVREPVYALAVHGMDGLGGAILPDSGAVARGVAADFLIETLSARPGEVVVIAVGPLTNLALAEQRMPGVLMLARRVIAMGGAIGVSGNVTPVAEFNFFADPHAAQAVIRSGASLVLVPLDVTHQVGLTAPVVGRIAAVDTPVARFVAAAVQSILRLGETLDGDPVVYLHDPLAVGLAIQPDVCDVAALSLDVETEGVLTMGQVVADRRAVVLEGARWGRTVGCAMGVNAEAFVAMFVGRVIGGPGDDGRWTTDDGKDKRE